jgi:bifunctional non-homologous end joining protein LigD
MAWKIADRTGKIFIDHNMNRSGANISAAYSLRPEPGAPVSTPLTWDEVFEGGFVPTDFRIDNVWERFEQVGDLFDGVRTEAMDLTAAFESLGVDATASDGARPDVDAPLPRTAAKTMAGRTSDEVAAASKDPALFEYVRRRDFGPEGTTEPAPGEVSPGGNSFVIHKHRATRLHYDVRLERDGGLPSWAVPKGLPIAKGDKRLAVQTEVHPLEYGKFEGTIPEGHYGAGEVRIFDDGWYEPVEWTDTKVSFVLHGRRYPGLEFHFVKTNRDWLAFLASAQNASPIAAAPRLDPMLAEGGWEAFDDDAWWFEPKLDGIRCVAELSTGDTVLRTRTGRDASGSYPELRMVHELVDQVNAVIDGEIVAFDDAGRPSFEVLQQRMNLSGERAIARASKAIPVSLVVFDLLWLDGHDTTGLTLQQRRELLDLIVEQDHRLQVTAHVAGDGISFTERARTLGLEGVMAKRVGSPYLPGRRTPDWRKIKLMNTQACAILGWTPGKGGRAGSFGALLVGAIDDTGAMRWVGQVGSGFTESMLERLMKDLAPLVRPDPPIDDADLAAVKAATFVEPRLVCEVRYLEMTKSTGKMRAPSFLGMRPDIAPEDTVLEPIAGSKRATGSAKPR